LPVFLFLLFIIISPSTPKVSKSGFFRVKTFIISHLFSISPYIVVRKTGVFETKTFIMSHLFSMPPILISPKSAFLRIKLSSWFIFLLYSYPQNRCFYAINFHLASSFFYIPLYYSDEIRAFCAINFHIASFFFIPDSIPIGIPFRYGRLFPFVHYPGIDLRGVQSCVAK
jgi:hypothetical protein